MGKSEGREELNSKKKIRIRYTEPAGCKTTDAHRRLSDGGWRATDSGLKITNGLGKGMGPSLRGRSSQKERNQVFKGKPGGGDSKGSGYVRGRLLGEGAVRKGLCPGRG